VDLAALTCLDSLLREHFPDAAVVNTCPHRFLRLGFTDRDVAAAWHNGFDPTFQWFLGLPEAWPASTYDPPHWVNSVSAALKALHRSVTPASPANLSTRYGEFRAGRWARRWEFHPRWDWVYPEGSESGCELSGTSIRLAAYDHRWLGGLYPPADGPGQPPPDPEEGSAAPPPGPPGPSLSPQPAPGDADDVRLHGGDEPSVPPPPRPGLVFGEGYIGVGGRVLPVACPDVLAALRVLYEARPITVNFRDRLPHLGRMDRVFGKARSKVPAELRRHIKGTTGSGYRWVD
jgi:hypothetical protein